MQWIITLAFCAAVKILAMLEWAPLYRAFLGIPARWISFVSGENFEESDGTYLFTDFILDYSCSGIHFFILLCLAGMAGGRAIKFWQGIPLAYAATLIANSARIYIALRLQRPGLHEAVGTAVFVFFLLVYYEIFRRKFAEN
jgi:hypothetical protein